MKKQLIFTVISLLFIIRYALGASPDNSTQVVRGQVVDAGSLQPIPGVNVIVMDSNPVMGTATDPDGRFRFNHIDLGRKGFKFTFVGYIDVVLPQVQVDTGKEVVLNVRMEESVNMMNDIVIEARKSNDYEVMNELATVSARVFNLEETQRYAGSRNDPARMATNFAGVSGANDARNDIIIWGNSPTGLLWRLEGYSIK